jgi:hypothetical protein
MVRLTLLCMFATALGAAACQKKTEQGGSPAGDKSDTSGTPSAPAVSVVAATTSSDATTSGRFKCPFPKRCDPACKAVFSKTTAACQKESDAMISAMGKANADGFGKCNAACVTHKDQCIGAATPQECRCAEDCEKRLSAEVKATLEGYKECVAKIIAACE